MNERLTHIDLFSGIGGFSLAAEWCGIETIAFCECDKFCQAVLKKHWPEAPCYDDVKTFPSEKYTGAFLLTAGVPCQPASCAGKRRGKEDDRWLWPECFRIIREAKPAWCILENVRGLLSLESGMVFNSLLSEMENIGYEVQAFVIPACAVNAPHRRDRVWIMAHTNDAETTRQRTNGGKRLSEPKAEQFGATSKDVAHTASVGTWATEQSGQWNGVESGGKVLADTEYGRMAKRRGTSNPCATQVDERRKERNDRTGFFVQKEKGRIISNSDNTGFKEQRRTERTQKEYQTTECYCEWLPEPRVGRVVDGIPHRVDRLKGLGNSIVPQIAAELMRMIIEAGG